MSLSKSDAGTRRFGTALARVVWAIALSVPILVLAGLALTPLFPVPPFDPVPVEADSTLSYDGLFPYYLEYVAMTRIHPRGQEPGGRHGHAAFYLKGVERDAAAKPYPQLRLVGEGADLADPNTGVGVSVNKIFKNVNWVAFDGAALFYGGGMADGVVIDRNVRDVVVDRVLASGALAGVEVHESAWADRPPGLRRARHMALQSIGTDFALRFGRDLACVRIPLTRAMMARVVEYLNAMNARYAEDPGLDFEWSGVEDNCTHLAVNALAQVSGIDPVKTHSGRVMRFFNLAIPANVFVDLATAGNDYGGLRRGDRPDEIDGETLDRYGWMLAQPGVIVRFLPRFRANNWLWEGNFDMYTMERPVVPLVLIPPLAVVPVGSKWVWPPVYRFKQKAYRRLFLDPRYCDLRANLEHYLAATEGEIARPKTAGDADDASSCSEYLETTRATVRAALDGH